MKAFVDQINGDKALLLLGDDESVKVAVPLEWLPAGSREGTVLRLDFAIDNESTARAKARIQSLLEDLGNNP